MDVRSLHPATGRRRGALPSLALGGSMIVLLGAGQARASVQQSGGSQTPFPGAGQQQVSATLEQCQTALGQSERSATFAGEMTSIAGAVRMQMRIDVLERMPSEARFHMVRAPGLGVWRTSAAGVKAYKYLKQVTNLSAPAYYRAAVRFRWLNTQSRLIKALERLTPACYQPPAPAGEPAPTAPQAGGAGSSAAGPGAPAATTL